jgi:hypothetical protein
MGDLYDVEYEQTDGTDCKSAPALEIFLPMTKFTPLQGGRGAKIPPSNRAPHTIKSNNSHLFLKFVKQNNLNFYF